jgi:YjbR
MPDIDSIRALCLSFPDATEDMPWPDDLCFKVRGRIFAGMALSDGRFPRITLKCPPDQFHELLEVDGIAPRPTSAVTTGYKWRIPTCCLSANSKTSSASRTHWSLPKYRNHKERKLP